MLEDNFWELGSPGLWIAEIEHKSDVLPSKSFYQSQWVNFIFALIF